MRFAMQMLKKIHTGYLLLRIPSCQHLHALGILVGIFLHHREKVYLRMKPYRGKQKQVVKETMIQSPWIQPCLKPVTSRIPVDR